MGNRDKHSMDIYVSSVEPLKNTAHGNPVWLINDTFKTEPNANWVDGVSFRKLEGEHINVDIKPTKHKYDYITRINDAPERVMSKSKTIDAKIDRFLETASKSDKDRVMNMLDKVKGGKRKGPSL